VGVSEPLSLGERGSELWRGLAEGVTDAGRLVLIAEAARLADRLDELDNVIQGKGVLNLMQFRVLSREQVGDDVNLNIEVKFQNVLSEARQQASALAGLLKSIGAAGEGAAVPVVAPKSPLDELMAKRREKAGKAG